MLGELGRFDVVDVSGEVDRLRAVKTSEEVAAHVHAAEIARLAVCALREFRDERDVADDFAIAAAAESKARQLRADWALCLVGIGRGAVT